MNSIGPEVGFQVSYRKKTSKCEYDTLIDNAIIDELSTSEPLSSLELKGRVEARLNRHISYNTYIAHIRRMLDRNELTRRDTGEKAKPAVFYYSTEYSRKKRRLEILRPFPEQIHETIKAYAEIFYSIIAKNIRDTSIPGISVSEFIAEHAHKNNVVLERQEVQKRFKRLEEIGLFTRCRKKFNGESRYLISNPALADLALDLQDLLKIENKVFNFEFQYFRGASSDEKRRMLIIHGKKKAEKMMKRFNLQRNKFRSGLLKTYGEAKISKAIEILEGVEETRIRDLIELDRKIKRRHSITIKIYEYFHDIIEMIWPTLLHVKEHMSETMIQAILVIASALFCILARHFLFMINYVNIAQQFWFYVT